MLVSITIHPMSALASASGEYIEIFKSTESVTLNYARGMWPELRMFEQQDWYGFAGACRLPSGSDPWIYEGENFIAIVAGDDC